MTDEAASVQIVDVFTARRHASRVCPSHVRARVKRLNEGPCKQCHAIAQRL